MKTQLEKIKAMKTAEAKVLEHTMLVDVYTKVNRKDVADIAEPLADALGFKYKLITDLVNKATPSNKIAAATTAIKLSKTPGAFLLLADTTKDVRGWTTNYTQKSIPTYVYHTDEDRYYTAQEYAEVAEEMFSLDTLQIQQTKGAKITLYNIHDKPETTLELTREELEDIAESFGMVTGWTFSGPIRRQFLTPQQITSLKEITLLPSAGFGNSGSGFASTVRPFHDSLIEVEYPNSKTTVTPSRQTILKKGKAVPTSELRTFAEYFYNLSNLDQYLNIGITTDDWHICNCGNPVRTHGETQDDGFCPYCDSPIPGFVAIKFENAEYIARPDKNFARIEATVDKSYWIKVFRRYKERKLGCSQSFLHEHHCIKSIVYYAAK